MKAVDRLSQAGGEGRRTCHFPLQADKIMSLTEPAEFLQALHDGLKVGDDIRPKAKEKGELMIYDRCMVTGMMMMSCMYVCRWCKVD